MTWGLLIGNRAKRQLRRLSRGERERIGDIFSELRHDPFHGDVKILRGLGALRRRVGDWRIMFDLDHANRVIKVTNVERRNSNSY
jgi:mRNA-degrading endonuclease RelE of RelBE toxin-antitoxin system